MAHKYLYWTHKNVPSSLKLVIYTWMLNVPCDSKVILCSPLHFGLIRERHEKPTAYKWQTLRASDLCRPEGPPELTALNWLICKQTLVHARALNCGTLLRSPVAVATHKEWAWVVPRKGAQRLLVYCTSDLSAHFSLRETESVPAGWRAQVGRDLPFLQHKCLQSLFSP